jgi:hypothetical protein
MGRGSGRNPSLSMLVQKIINELEDGLDHERREPSAPHFAGKRQLVAKIRKNAKRPEL